MQLLSSVGLECSNRRSWPPTSLPWDSSSIPAFPGTTRSNPAFPGPAAPSQEGRTAQPCTPIPGTATSSQRCAGSFFPLFQLQSPCPHGRPLVHRTVLLSLFPHYCPLQRAGNESCPRHVPRGAVGFQAGSLVIGPTAGGCTGRDESPWL